VAPSSVDACQNPLDPPDRDSPALRAFLRHFRIDVTASPRALLGDIARAFARIPYENLTKILKESREGRSRTTKRGAEEVVGEHIRLGTGGTCFSLTATLVHILRALGFRAEPLLADRHYGEDTHSALVVWIDATPHLLDPGFLIVDAIPLDAAKSGELDVETRFNRLLLVPNDDGSKIELRTVHQEGPNRRPSEVSRLTFKTDPADPDRFLDAWTASFDWDMMRYPLLTRVDGERQLYLQDRRFQTRTKESVDRIDVDPTRLVERIARDFGIDATVAAEALAVIEGARRGR